METITKAKHSETPFQITGVTETTVRDANDKIIHDGSNYQLEYYEAKANAKLIAAAPLLLEALDFIVNDCEPGEDAKLTVAGYNKACAAIKKATE